MKQDGLLPRQKQAFCFCAFSAPAVAAASHLPWPWVLGLTALMAALLLLPQRQIMLCGSLGKTVLLLQAVFAAVLLWQFALGSVSAFPDDAVMPFVPLTLLAVSTWAACRGRTACARAVGVLFFLLGALYLTVFFFALREADFSRVMELPRGQDVRPLGVVLLLPFYGRYLSAQTSEKRSGAGWLIAFVLLPTLAALFCTLVPGSGGKFYTMVKSVELFSFAQRMEPLVSVAATAGWFSALCLLQVSAGVLCRAALGTKESVGALVSGGFAAAGVLWGKSLSPAILLPLGAVFCVLFPFAAQVFASEKNS